MFNWLFGPLTTYGKELYDSAVTAPMPAYTAMVLTLLVEAIAFICLTLGKNRRAIDGVAGAGLMLLVAICAAGQQQGTLRAAFVMWFTAAATFALFAGLACIWFFDHRGMRRSSSDVAARTPRSVLPATFVLTLGLLGLSCLFGEMMLAGYEPANTWAFLMGATEYLAPLALVAGLLLAAWRRFTRSRFFVWLSEPDKNSAAAVTSRLNRLR